MLSEKALAKLPPGSFVRFCDTVDMDGNPRKCVVWAYTMDHTARVSQFCTETGEYLGDTFFHS